MVATTPRPDDCVSGWALTRPTENWQHLLLLLTPTDTEPRAAHQSANRNTVENNMRNNYNRTTEETTTLGKKNRKTP